MKYNRGKNFSFESMCLVLIAQQQRMLNELFGIHSTYET
jgi:hypothetical protein